MPYRGRRRIGSDPALPKRSQIRHELALVERRLAEHGIRLMPTASRWLTAELDAGVGVGTVRSLEDARRAGAAMLAAAAELHGVKSSVRIADLRRAWKYQLSAGNCPPHECLFRTVVSRSDDDLARFELYRNILDLP